MLQLQYLRSILLLNNLSSLIISFIESTHYSYWEADRQATFITMGVFFLFSWLISLATVAYTTFQVRKARKSGYFRVPLTTDVADAEDFEVAQGPRMGPKVSFIVAITDLVFVISFIFLIAFAFVAARNQAATVAAIGAIVAAVVHIFFVLEASYRGILSRYTVRISFVRREQKNMLSSMSGAKEQSSSASSMQEPEHMSPRPYRGSPSTKPSKAPESDANNPIRLIEATEGDALIADHD